MKYLTFIALFLTLNLSAQEYSLLEINAKWNAKNNLPQKELAGLDIKFAWLENQPQVIQESVKAVPMLILMKDGRPIHQWQAGINLKLAITDEDIKKILSKIN
jgi:hypothetical protein